MMLHWNELLAVDLQILTTPEVWERGIVYFDDGHLQTTCRLDDILAGEVAGTGGTYQVKMWLENGQIQYECNCPYPGFCKHLVALGIAWCNAPERFFDLNPAWAGLQQDAAAQQAFLHRLIHKFPLLLWQDLQSMDSGDEFLSNRAVLNFIRNTFKFTGKSFHNVAGLWEHVGRIQKYLAVALRQGDLEVVGGILELLQGLMAEFRQASEATTIQQCIDEVLTLVWELPNHFAVECLYPVIELLLEYCLDPGLWPLHPAFRKGLVGFGPATEPYLLSQIATRMVPECEELQLMAIYELLSEYETENPLFQTQREQVIELLAARDSGRLWLIDRWLEQDPKQALCWAKQGLRTSDAQLKTAYRERLIRLHQIQNEPRQAATLSFLQFQADPSFAEYLRLKAIVSQLPDDWAVYRKRVDEWVTHRADKGLQLHIAIDQEDVERVAGWVSEDLREEDLLGLAEMLQQRPSLPLLAIYPPVTESLLRLGLPHHRKTAFAVMAAFKKLCLKNGREDLWEEFRTVWENELGTDSRFRQKFGALFSGRENG